MASTSAVLDVVYEVDIVSYGISIVGLPLFGALSCIVICLMFHFDAVLEANCNVSIFTVAIDRVPFLVTSYTVILPLLSPRASIEPSGTCKKRGTLVNCGLIFHSHSSLGRVLNISLILRSQVPNYLPSISAATGLAPEKYIWQIAIGLTSLQTFRNDAMYYNYFQRNLAVAKQPWFARWNKANYVLGVIENVGLLLVVNVSHLDDISKYWPFSPPSCQYNSGTCCQSTYDPLTVDSCGSENE